MEPLDFVLAVSDGTRVHLGEARGFLEAGAAYLAAKGISDSEILEIEKCLLALKAQMDDSQAFADTDAKFQALVLQASRNPLLTRLVKSIKALDGESRVLSVQRRGVARRVVVDLAAVRAGLKARDAEGARDAMSAHILHSQELLRRAM